MVIDVSHANEKTFEGILDVYEQEKTKGSVIIASHSNVRKICNNERNLTDKEQIRLKNVGGHIVLVLYSEFIMNENQVDTEVTQKEKFMEHLDYVINNIGFNVDKIMIATDNMELFENEKYKDSSILKIEKVKQELYSLISKKYGHNVAIKILRENVENLIKKIK